MSDPDYSDDQVSTEFLMLIGRIVIVWSRIERAADLALACCRSFAPDQFPKGQSPVAIKRKIKALRTICLRLPAFARSPSWVEGQLDRVLELAEDRHVIVHGFFHGVSEDDPPKIMFRLARYQSGGTEGRTLNATKGDLLEFLSDLLTADHNFMLIMMMVNQEVRKARRTASTLAPRSS